MGGLPGGGGMGALQPEVHIWNGGEVGVGAGLSGGWGSGGDAVTVVAYFNQLLLENLGKYRPLFNSIFVLSSCYYGMMMIAS